MSSFSAAVVSWTSTPRPVEMRKNTSHMATPSVSIRMAMSASSSWFGPITVVLTWTTKPWRCSCPIAARVASKCPEIPRIASWVAAVAPSRLSEAVFTPWRRREPRTASVSAGVTEGATATGTPTCSACATSSMMSLRFRQSPPVRIRIGRGRPTRASSSISARPSSVESSSAPGSSWAQARQWRQAKPQAVVISQNTSRGRSSKRRPPGSAGGRTRESPADRRPGCPLFTLRACVKSCRVDQGRWSHLQRRPRITSHPRGTRLPAMRAGRRRPERMTMWPSGIALDRQQ